MDAPVIVIWGPAVFGEGLTRDDPQASSKRTSPSQNVERSDDEDISLVTISSAAFEPWLESERVEH
jgi:hypothetical protein